eukprot:7380329-Prymnesium_polylepis.1
MAPRSTRIARQKAPYARIELGLAKSALLSAAHCVSDSGASASDVRVPMADMRETPASAPPIDSTPPSRDGRSLEEAGTSTVLVICCSSASSASCCQRARYISGNEP